MCLLVVAALFARTALVTSRTDLGFDADQMLAVSLGGSRRNFNEAAYVHAATTALRGLPSVELLSVIDRVPWGWSHHRIRFDHAGRSYMVNITGSDEEFFRAAGVRVLRGRPFTRDEVEHAASVALVSETVARAFFHGVDPIGQPLSRVPSVTLETEPATVIGVTADALLTSMDAEVYGAIYRPIRRLSADPSNSTSTTPPGFVIRTASPARTAREVERALRIIDSRVQPASIIVRERIEEFVGWKRTFAWLSVPAAVFVVLLSMLGLFGVTVFVVTERMSELSIRMALGASSANVQRLLVTDSLRPVLIGLTAGLFGALLASRLTARMFNLSGISPHDPVAVGVALAVLLTGALAAVLIPTWRAARANPANLLRSA
jgi:hypothetical protein